MCWVNNNAGIGLAVSGTGNIPSFTTTNATTSPITATITVTPTTPVGCTGTPISFTITVNPTATLNAIANKVVCNGSSVPVTILSGPVSGAVYTWTNNRPAIGLAASGTGFIPSFVASIGASNPVTATIRVYSSITNGGVTCIGDSMVFIIVVNPTATVNSVTNQTLCNGVSTAAINFTSPTSGGAGSNIIFNWVNNTPSIGLAASGSGNIPSFTATCGRETACFYHTAGYRTRINSGRTRS